MPSASFFTQRDAAIEYTRYAALCDALFTTAGETVAVVADAETKIALATLSRRAGLHAAAWGELVPESVLLADERASAVTPTAIARDPAAIATALRTLRADLDAAVARMSPVADRPALRLAADVLADIDEALAVLRHPTGG